MVETVVRNCITSVPQDDIIDLPGSVVYSRAVEILINIPRRKEVIPVRPVLFIYRIAASGGVNKYLTGIPKPIAPSFAAMVCLHFRVVFERNRNEMSDRINCPITSRAPSTGVFPT